MDGYLSFGKEKVSGVRQPERMKNKKTTEPDEFPIEVVKNWERIEFCGRQKIMQDIKVKGKPEGRKS